MGGEKGTPHTNGGDVFICVFEQGLFLQTCFAEFYISKIPIFHS